MNKLRKGLLFGGVLAAMSYALVAYAYPMPGPDEEVYVVYYWDAARTNIAGQRGVSHGSACVAWHATYGSTTQYTRVFLEKCPTDGGGIDF